MDEPLILIDEQGAVTRLTINRPKNLNALNREVLRELDAMLDELTPQTRVLVITGAGDKAFVAGADIVEMSQYNPVQARSFSALGHEVFARFAALEPIVIAEVNGFALGGGCELMLACDFAIAADSAKLGQPEVKLGLTPGFGGTTRLLRRIGLSRAIQLITSGEAIEAKEAHRLGLLNEVVPKAELRARVEAIASAIVANGPHAVAWAKRAAHVAAEADLATANAYEQELFGICFSTEEHHEGMKAFLEKRKPTFG